MSALADKEFRVSESKHPGDILHELTVEVTDSDGTVQPPGWYFWDETWQRTGPYPTREKAQEALFKYTESL